MEATTLCKIHRTMDPNGRDGQLWLTMGSIWIHCGFHHFDAVGRAILVVNWKSIADRTAASKAQRWSAHGHNSQWLWQNQVEWAASSNMDGSINADGRLAPYFTLRLDSHGLYLMGLIRVPASIDLSTLNTHGKSDRHICFIFYMRRSEPSLYL